jgi:hypothetical protein
LRYYRLGTWLLAGWGMLMWLRQRGRLGASSGKARAPVLHCRWRAWRRRSAITAPSPLLRRPVTVIRAYLRAE